MLNKQVYLLITLVILSGLFHHAAAQKDSIVLSNGDILVGEIKSMDKGVLMIETPYSDDDFGVKWVQVKEVFSKVQFLINLQDGRHMNSILTTKSPGVLVIENEDDELEEINIYQLVYLKSLESKFWSRVNASVDVGLNISKANNLAQLNGSASLGYIEEKWGFDAYFTYASSSQDSIASTKRKEGGLNFRYFLPKDWYILPEATYLSNTEQALHYRLNGKLGAGRYIQHSNKSYWGVVGGLSFNDETFTNNTPERKSTEAYGGTELNMFDTGDLTLLSNIYVYPSLTEKGRVRSDFKLDMKYEFVHDFYVKLNVTYNYDNQPAIQGHESDYVYGFSIGWEL